MKEKLPIRSFDAETQALIRSAIAEVCGPQADKRFVGKVIRDARVHPGRPDADYYIVSLADWPMGRKRLHVYKPGKSHPMKGARLPIPTPVSRRKALEDLRSRPPYMGLARCFYQAAISGLTKQEIVAYLTKHGVERNTYSNRYWREQRIPYTEADIRNQVRAYTRKCGIDFPASLERTHCSRCGQPLR